MFVFSELKVCMIVYSSSFLFFIKHSYRSIACSPELLSCLLCGSKSGLSESLLFTCGSVANPIKPTLPPVLQGPQLQPPVWHQCEFGSFPFLWGLFTVCMNVPWFQEFSQKSSHEGHWIYSTDILISCFINSSRIKHLFIDCSVQWLKRNSLKNSWSSPVILHSSG